MVLFLTLLLIMSTTSAVLNEGTDHAVGDLLPEQTDGDSSTGTYMRVPLEGQNTLDILEKNKINIIDDSGWAAIVRVNEKQKEALENNQRIKLEEIKDRTTINLFEEGIKFDTGQGPDLDLKWKVSEGNYHLVQFIAQARPDWRKDIQNTVGEIHRSVGDNAVVVELTDDQKKSLMERDYVEWIGIYQPAYKVQRDLKEASGEIDVRIEPYHQKEVSLIEKKLSGFGATDMETEPLTNELTYVTATIQADRLPDVASIEEVKLIKNDPENKIYNNIGGNVVQADEAWNITKSNLNNQVTGRNVTIHIQDTGMDRDHPDFNQGPLGDRVKYYEDPNGDGTDTHYHGTHVTGSAAGNGYLMEQFLGLDNTNREYGELADLNPAGYNDRSGFAGRAPEAYIVNYEGLDTSEWQTSYDTYDSRIFSNSWGPSVIDQTYDGGGDSFLLSNPDSIVVFAAGNDGPFIHTSTGIANDKNTIAVGAAENMRPERGEDDPNQLEDYSSRGPTANGRIKPDVVEFAGSHGPNAESQTPGTPVYENNTIDEDGDGNADYRNMGGTSTACPHLSGDAALVRQYLRDEKGYSNLNMRGDLVKALLIYSAEDMGYGYPSFQQGWGRVNVKNIVNPPAPTSYNIYENTGSYQRTIDVKSGDVPLKLVMSYMDDDSSGESLVTDY
ncbi:MAG: S8 family serine peptidase, partial [Candidatus Thermoplasmatota archaeon]